MNLNDLPPPVSDGCTVCKTQQTATVDGICGRRCAAHPPTFVPRRAVDIAIELGPEAALRYCRTDLAS